jgi:uncharacterized protein
MIMDKTQERKNGAIKQKKKEKYKHFCHDLQRKKKLVVALSGGMDSSLVASIARQVLGEKKILAVTIDSELFPRWEREMAHRVAKKLGIRHIIKKVSLLTETLQQNTPQRCYQCKKMMADVLWDIAHQEHMDIIADGVTCDDLADGSYIGVKAWTETGIWHPLAQYGFTQTEIISLAREQGLDNYDKPPESCLATRLAPYEIITPEKLRMIEEAENFLHIHVSLVRVRLHQGLARIEVAPQDIQKIVDMKEEITQKFADMGFLHVTVDLRGYKTRNMKLSSSPKNYSKKIG